MSDEIMVYKESGKLYSKIVDLITSRKIAVSKVMNTAMLFLYWEIGEDDPVALILCAEKSQETVELMELNQGSIHVDAPEEAVGRKTGDSYRQCKRATGTAVISYPSNIRRLSP